MKFVSKIRRMGELIYIRVPKSFIKSKLVDVGLECEIELKEKK